MLASLVYSYRRKKCFFVFLKHVFSSVKQMKVMDIKCHKKDVWIYSEKVGLNKTIETF